MKKRYLLFILCILLAGCSAKDHDSSPQESLQSEDLVVESAESYKEYPEEEEPDSEAEESIVAEESEITQPSGSTVESSAPASSSAASSFSEASSSAPTTASGSAAGDNPASTSSGEPASSSPAQEAGQSKSSDLSGTSFLSDVESEVIGLINAERKALGLQALKYDNKLQQAARIRSRELYQNNQFSHSRPNGDPWQTVLKTDVPVSYATAGENLAQVEHNMPDYDPAYDAGYWYETWENSPSHYENMVRDTFTHVGVGIYYRVRNGMTTAYATTIFVSYP